MRRIQKRLTHFHHIRFEDIQTRKEDSTTSDLFYDCRTYCQASERLAILRGRLYSALDLRKSHADRMPYWNNKSLVWSGFCLFKTADDVCAPVSKRKAHVNLHVSHESFYREKHSSNIFTRVSLHRTGSSCESLDWIFTFHDMNFGMKGRILWCGLLQRVLREKLYLKCIILQLSSARNRDNLKYHLRFAQHRP